MAIDRKDLLSIEQIGYRYQINNNNIIVQFGNIYYYQTINFLLLSNYLTPKKRINHDKPDFATKQRMLGLLNIDEDPPLSMTAGPAVLQLLLVCVSRVSFVLEKFGSPPEEKVGKKNQHKK